MTSKARILFQTGSSHGSSARSRPWMISKCLVRIAQRGFRGFLVSALAVFGSSEVSDGALGPGDRGALDAQLFGLRCDLSL